ncbi:FixH family protein [Caenispirillum salinarum]|uniref:FixH family protein n=1 Tax=Caenispirillum salinarum TaxID=859058 RepID=UPI00384C127C
MSMTGNTPRPSGWWYPYIFVAAFMVVVGVNGALAYFATSTFNGLETRNAYEKGRLYNQTLAEAEAQKALGWTVGLQAEQMTKDRPGDYPADLMISATGPDGEGLEGLEVFAEIRRPTQAGMDQEVRLTRRDTGRYGTKIVLPQPGQWEIRVLARKGDDTFRMYDRIFVK